MSATYDPEVTHQSAQMTAVRHLGLDNRIYASSLPWFVFFFFTVKGLLRRPNTPKSPVGGPRGPVIALSAFPGEALRFPADRDVGPWTCCRCVGQIEI
jgi:hypothetical protein